MNKFQKGDKVLYKDNEYTVVYSFPSFNEEHVCYCIKRAGSHDFLTFEENLRPVVDFKIDEAEILSVVTENE